MNARKSQTITHAESAIIVRALDDELAEAHSYRHQHIEGYESQAEQTRELRRRSGIAPGLACKYPKTHLLAAIAEQEPREYVHRHTMLPLTAAVPRIYGQKEASTDDWFDISCHLGLERPIEEVRLCVECVDQDLSDNRLPVYRRCHHIRGTSRCLQHGVRLHAVRDRAPFSALPTHWIDSGLVQLVLDVEAAVPDGSWMQPYREICVAMLGAGRPMACTAVNDALIEALDAVGLSTNIRRPKPLVSDFIRDRAGKKWVAENIAVIHAYPRGEVITMVDGLTEQRSRVRTWIVYAAMWACLDDDPWTNTQRMDMRRSSSRVAEAA